MTVYVALLRGINVGGHNKLPMATLRALATGCGFTDVQTYIQSGNVVFGSRLGATKVATALHHAILAECAIDSRVVIRTGPDLVTVVAQNPFLERGADEKLQHVVFMYPESAPTLSGVDPQFYAPEEVEVIGPNAYLHTPNGVGQSKLATETTMRKLGIVGTVRNWRTVSTLAEMAAAR